jgi:hypothetical protein
MSHYQPGPITAAHSLAVFPAEVFCATDGVNHAEAITFPSTLCLGDAYTLRTTTPAQPLPLQELPATGLRPTLKVNQANALEVPGTRATIAARLTFMTQIGASVEVLVIACDGPDARVYLHPLGGLEANTEYMLIAIDENITELPIADLTGISFSRGTRITTATGAQIPVEQIKEGDRILTRDHGMQPIRWIGTRTVQAVGAFAPVVIGHGALGNAEALIVSQTHRMMLSDWRAEVLTGSKDVLIEALDLVNDDDIYIRTGGFVEYTQLVFDEHQIIYAEGVATESLHLTAQILSGLPEETCAEILKRFPNIAFEDPSFSRVPLDHAAARTFLKHVGRL